MITANFQEGRCKKFEHDTLPQFDCSMDPENDECTKSLCKDEIGPVCGSDGITYRFEEKDCTYPIPPGVEVDYTGECCIDKCSSLDFNPICDSSNVTYLVSSLLFFPTLPILFKEPLRIWKRKMLGDEDGKKI